MNNIKKGDNKMDKFNNEVFKKYKQVRRGLTSETEALAYLQGYGEALEHTGAHEPPYSEALSLFLGSKQQKEKSKKFFGIQ